MKIYISSKKKALISRITGQNGSYLAKFLLAKVNKVQTDIYCGEDDIIRREDVYALGQGLEG